MQTNDNQSFDLKNEHKDFFTAQLQSYAEDIGAIIRDSLEVSNTSFSEAKERYQQQDWSEVANDIYEALNEIDDSPLAKLIHGVTYGITDQAIKIASVVVDKVAERFGETLTTTINDSDTIKRLSDNLAKEIHSDIKKDTLNPNWQRNIETSFDPMESLEPEPDKDYLDVIAKRETSAQNASQSQGMER